MSLRRFAWTFASWVVLGAALAGVLLSSGVRAERAPGGAVEIALAILRFHATGIAGIAYALGLVVGSHEQPERRAPAVLAVLVPLAALTSAAIALTASALTLRATAGLVAGDYRAALAQRIDASDPLLGLAWACVAAGLMASSAPGLLARMNRAIAWLPAKLFLGWLYAVAVVAAVEFAGRLIVLRALG